MIRFLAVLFIFLFTHSLHASNNTKSHFDLKSFDAIEDILAMVDPLTGYKSICGADDMRTPSNLPFYGRAQAQGRRGGCSVTMIGETCAVSAGHCLSVLDELHFNVPQTIGTRPQRPAPEDRYFVDQETIVYQDAGIGRDWAVFRVLPNELTGLYAGEVQGYLEVDADLKVRRGREIRITGYGSSPVLEGRHFTQQTHTGPVVSTFGARFFWRHFFNRGIIRHQADTTGGNSGSSVVDEQTGRIVGIHSHGGCGSIGGNPAFGNSSSSIRGSRQLQRAINRCLEWEAENL